MVTALFVLVGQLLLRRQQKDKLIAEASGEVAEGARILLEQYRAALESSRTELVGLRDRVSKLEQSLKDAKEDHARLEADRQQALADLARVQERVRFLERQVDLLDPAVRSESRR